MSTNSKTGSIYGPPAAASVQHLTCRLFACTRVDRPRPNERGPMARRFRDRFQSVPISPSTTIDRPYAETHASVVEPGRTNGLVHGLVRAIRARSSDRSRTWGNGQ